MATDSPTADTPTKTPDLADDPSVKDDKANPTPAEAVTDVEKKIRRAERFGITVKLSEQEKRSSRAERFGTISPPSGESPRGKEGSKQSEELKRKARAERFGVPAPTDNEAKKKARLERFGSIPKTDSAEEDKRKARAARFSQAPANAISLNGNDAIEPKAPLLAMLTEGLKQRFISFSSSFRAFRVCR